MSSFFLKIFLETGMPDHDSCPEARCPAPTAPQPILVALADCGVLSSRVVGGKAQNLGRLMANGFAVPAGFCITTLGYRQFLMQNPQLLPLIQAVQAATTIASRQEVAGELRCGFETAQFSPELQAAVVGEYQKLGKLARVAVRSSACAEDSATASFAGQQETILGVTGSEALLLALRRCWSSLWSATAVTYRDKLSIAADQAQMAIVVQRMVDSRSAGVAFSVNPLTGNGDQCWIEAAYGLGESVVAGQVTPDRYLVACDGNKLRTIQTVVGDKSTAIWLQPQGTQSQTVAAGRRHKRVLKSAQVLAIAQVVRTIQTKFGRPQDIEWAYDRSRLFVLQTRPITTTPPAPEPLEIVYGSAATPKLIHDTPIVWSNFNLNETMPFPQPMLNWCVWNDQALPRFIEMLSISDRRLSEHFHLVDRLNGRLYWNMNLLLNLPIVGTIFRIGLQGTDVHAARTVKELQEQGLLPPVVFPNAGLGIARWAKFFGRLLWMLGHGFWLIFFPANIRKLQEQLTQYVRQLREQPVERLTEQELLHSYDHIIATVFSRMDELVSLMGLGIPHYGLLELWCRRWPDIPAGALAAGAPGNPTTQAALAMWDLSRAEPAVIALLTNTPANECWQALQATELGRGYLTRVQTFLDNFGHRVAREFDLSCPRWTDEPAMVFEVIQLYLKSDQNPHDHFAAQAANAEKLGREAMRRLFFLWRPLFRLSFYMTRQYLPLREMPKHLFLMYFHLLRRNFMELGRRLTQRGILPDPIAIFQLSLQELREIVAQLERGEAVPTTVWQAHVVQRRQAMAKYEQWAAPGFIRSDRMPVAMAAGTEVVGELQGTGVSCGKVTARARVLLNFRDHREFQPGEILVTLVTDPGWTPLFLVASGLIMEVGGAISHGAVVAREYGIPAAVSVSHATTRIKTGDLITVDGFSGSVKIEQQPT